MSKRTILLCVLAVVSWSAVSAHVLVPPTGYSVGFTGTTRNGIQNYVCKRGSWTKTGATADLFTAAGRKLGNYWSVCNDRARSITYYWNVINSGGVSFESGSSKSGLQASPLTTVKVSTSAISEYLALVEVHRGVGGDAELVAFVSLTKTKGGLAPSKSLCTREGTTSGVPFTGTFTFYTQDRLPPKVPASIMPPGTFVHTVFLQGKRIFRFKNGRWNYAGFLSTLAPVAGGTPMGKMGTSARRDRYGSYLSVRFTGPNPSTVNGHTVRSARLNADGCPWQLLKFTSQTGYQSPLGAYKYGLVGATYGGDPPAMKSGFEGLVWGSVFTAQCYLYV